jgi:nicotinamide-nucleotide amidase
MFDHEMRDAAERVLHACRKRGLRLVTAESCTGGLVAAALTAIAGSSDVVERGFVTYSNEAKIEMLAVPSDTIVAHGAVSAQTAAAMARGAVRRAAADVAVSITGIVGPGGGTSQKPVGLVYLGMARRDGACRVEHRVFPGDRGEIRQAALVEALQMLEDEARAA